jgi:hypothetical protein
VLPLENGIKINLRALLAESLRIRRCDRKGSGAASDVFNSMIEIASDICNGVVEIGVI